MCGRMILNFGFRVQVVTLRPFWCFALKPSLKQLVRTALGALFQADPAVGMAWQVSGLERPQKQSQRGGWPFCWGQVDFTGGTARARWR